MDTMRRWPKPLYPQMHHQQEKASKPTTRWSILKFNNLVMYILGIKNILSKRIVHFIAE